MKLTPAPRLVSLFAIGSLIACAPSYATEEDQTITPGKGVGDLKLGMQQAPVRNLLGKPDGSGSTTTGEQIDYSVWKDTTPSIIRVFYNKDLKLVQINCQAPLPATADGISLKSTFSEIRSKYRNLKLIKYTTRKGFVNYYDDVKNGVAFEFTGLPGATQKLHAIIVHLPGRQVLSDSDEQPFSMRDKAKR